MRFHRTGKDSENEIRILIEKCKRLRWAVAWASRDFPLCNVLKENEHKIHQLAVGVHFYQTHPDFIAAFMSADKVRFVMNPAGIFHPKLYLFEHGDGSWDCITGSPNFTGPAFSLNAEVAVQFNNFDVDAGVAYDDIDLALNAFFAQGKRIGANDLHAYRSIWERQQPRLAALSGRYLPPTDKTKPKKSPLDVPLFVAEWPEYFASVRDDPNHSIEGRLAILEEARRLFLAYNHFHQMQDDDRRGIAGTFQTEKLPWLWFGSMKGHFFFPKAINDNIPGISDALDEIPINGEVVRGHFDRYLARIRRAYEKPGIGTATRLLAFKRPDYFVCLDSKNRDKLCEAFEIPKSVGLDEYWDQVVRRLTDSNWWNSPQPLDEVERRVWRCRAAFLDVRFYEPA